MANDKTITVFRIDPTTGRIDSKPNVFYYSYLSRNPQLLNQIIDPKKYSLVQGSSATEKIRINLQQTEPNLTSSEILEKLFGNEPTRNYLLFAIQSSTNTMDQSISLTTKPNIEPNTMDQLGQPVITNGPNYNGLILAAGLIAAAIILK